MKVCVVGGCGYLGRVLVNDLLEKGYKVRVFDKWLFKNPKESLALPDFIEGDLRNKDDVAKAFEGCDAVVHTAAIVGPQVCDMIPEQALDINFTYVPRIVEMCRKNKIKYIYTSTASVYGFDEEKFLDEESKDIIALSLYGKSKYYSERYITDSFPEATVFRLGTLCGLSPRMRYDLVVNIFSAQALNGDTLTVHGGEQWRPMVNIHDVSRGIQFALENDIPGLYNLMHANYNIKLIAEIVAAKLNAQIDIDPTKNDVRSTFAKNNKLRAEGFHTKYGILDAVKEIAADPNETWKDWKNPIYSNLEWTKKLLEEGGI